MSWLEILGRHREVLHRIPVRGDQLRIGRAYDNDVVLSDPHVAPHHLRLQRQADGVWTATDLGSINGSWLDAPSRRFEHAQLDDGSLIRIGHTGLRLRHAHSAVPPELPMSRALAPYLVLALIPLTLVLVLVDHWLVDTEKPDSANYIGTAVSVALALCAWSSAWALIGRVFAGRAKLFDHAALALAACCSLLLLIRGLNLAAYMLSAPDLLALGETLTWTLVGGIVYWHLAIVNAKHRAGKALGVAVLTLGGLALNWTLAYIDRDSVGPHPVLSYLEPQSLRLAKAESLDQFLAAVPSLQSELEHARLRLIEKSEHDGARHRDDHDSASTQQSLR